MEPIRKTFRIFCCLAVLLAISNSGSSAADDKFQVTILSSRPDMVSGGDALVQVDVPQNLSLDKVTVLLNGQQLSPSLQANADEHFLIGVVSGLKIGDNSLQVFSNDKGKGKAAVQITLKNHPITGPIFSGPQEQPFICQTLDFKLPDGSLLGPPLDANCSVKTVITYVYKSTEPQPTPGPNARPGIPVFKPLSDTSSLPSDVAWTATTKGEKVPYVVRVETGTINRAIYQFAVLSDPTKEAQPGPLAPPKAWNDRLLYTFGGGCTGGWFKQGATVGNGSLVSDSIVGKGYAEASATLNVFGNDCSDLLAAETMMMVKERFIKAYGKPLFTMSRGGSGGAEQQLPIADNYPGLLDGIIPSLTFPDVLANAQLLVDSEVLYNYYTKFGDSLTAEQKLAITGEGRITDFAGEAGRISPTGLCPPQLPKDQRYDPISNRKGTRCDVFDHLVNVYGRDPSTGFARRPIDNVGVQYGLAALNAGKISIDQFLDLNEKSGGYDNDGNIVPARGVADPLGLRAAYQTGRVTFGGAGLTMVPIIDVRPYRDMLPNGDVHLKVHSFSLRARLQRANGTFANEVMLTTALSYSAQTDEYAFEKMDEWLTNLVQTVPGDRTIAKIAAAKPADLADSCYTDTGERITETQTATGGKCNEPYHTYQSPRMIAGGPASNDNLKCQLKAIDFADYKASFTDTDKMRLKKIFPSGVCDWSKPGVEQQPVKGTWQSF